MGSLPYLGQRWMGEGRSLPPTLSSPEDRGASRINYTLPHLGQDGGVSRATNNKFNYRHNLPPSDEMYTDLCSLFE